MSNETHLCVLKKAKVIHSKLNAKKKKLTKYTVKFQSILVSSLFPSIEMHDVRESGVAMNGEDKGDSIASPEYFDEALLQL